MPPSDQLVAEHRTCDAAFARIETAVRHGDWSLARYAAEQFIELSEAHFRREEAGLFPALEALSPVAAGPTAVLRAEHVQLRELFADLTGSVGHHQRDRLLDTVDTLWLLLQQHNAKEEAVLYPLADRLLAVPTPQQQQRG